MFLYSDLSSSVVCILSSSFIVYDLFDVILYLAVAFLILSFNSLFILSFIQFYILFIIYLC